MQIMYANLYACVGVCAMHHCWENSYRRDRKETVSLLCVYECECCEEILVNKSRRLVIITIMLISLSYLSSDDP